MENIFTVKSKRGTACEHPMQFLFYPHALLIALISRTAQYTDTVSCGNVQPKAVCTRKCADVLWSGLRVQDSACSILHAHCF